MLDPSGEVIANNNRQKCFGGTLAKIRGGFLPRAPLQSTTLASAVYDPDRLPLELEFRSGKRYLFFQVPQDGYEELLPAESKGGYFNRSIRKRFAFRDLSKSAAPIVLGLSQN